MTDLFQFEWSVDQSGYDLGRRRRASDEPELLWIDPKRGRWGSSLEYEVVERRGGPLRYYRPREKFPVLWRRFATTCVDSESVLEFVTEFGLLGVDDENPIIDSVPAICATADLLRQTAGRLDGGDRKAAVRLINSARPKLSGRIVWADSLEITAEFRPIPLTLRSELLLQACEAITGKHEYRKCRNDGCREWFRIDPGRGAKTKRREFCSDRCRAAYAYRHKTKGVH